MPRLPLLCSALMLLASASVFADEASHAAQARKLLEVTHANKLTVPVYAQVQQMFAQRFAQAQAPVTKKAVLESYQAKANAELDKAIGWQKLEPQMVQLYTSAFSEAELEEMLAFYQTPVGRKVLEKMPTLVGQSVQLTQQSLQAAVPKVNQLVDDMNAELAAKKQ
ncbi:hypothetical protein A9179_12305 [Pseudomonas alcaligenes]|uniref:DUF2059 domain-containing protein n=1 Tax=Aquipseudomonas alcaligenes TaxID=43263 RepID=A0ABR7S3N3_AQUAC|nr:DUF2059 domain-containing protein [Pseudomonas alcaligenes]MBC9251058.1 hypothetical protein [Pseudomonas alcaligenes]